MVIYDTQSYSMPPESLGIPGTLSLYRERVRIIAGRRKMIEDGQDSDSNLSDFAPVVPPRVLRKHLGMTQAEFARALRIPLSTLRNWEQGRRTPDGPALALLRVAARKFRDKNIHRYKRSQGHK